VTDHNAIELPEAELLPPENSEPASKRTQEERVFEAGRELVLAVGPTRATLSDVARRSGVSRASIYRRWPDLHAVLGELFQREYLSMAMEAVAADARSIEGVLNPPTKRTRMVSALSTFASTIRNNDLLRAVVRFDPAYVATTLFVAPSGLLELSNLLTALLVEHGDDGTIRTDDASTLASAVTVVLIGYVMCGSLHFADEKATQASLEDTLTQMLRPKEP
jgi:AcrR family transcriptional regulator